MLAVTVSEDARFDGEVVGFIVIALLTTPLQAAGEEYLFRGFLLQSLGATRLSAPVCWVVSGALFATAHGQFDPPLFADRWLIGIVFAWLATIHRRARGVDRPARHQEHLRADPGRDPRRALGRHRPDGRDLAAVRARRGHAGACRMVDPVALPAAEPYRRLRPRSGRVGSRAG